jgi:hypothetical protein
MVKREGAAKILEHSLVRPLNQGELHDRILEYETEFFLNSKIIETVAKVRPEQFAV